MASTSLSSSTKATNEKLDKQEVVSSLRKLREQQNSALLEFARVSDDRREYERVIDVLKGLQKDRKCYRMIGTTLVQYDIGTVLPILESTLTNLIALTSKLEENLVKKNEEYKAFTEKYNIHVVSTGQ